MGGLSVCVLVVDSKQLTEDERDKLFDAIQKAVDIVGWTVTVLQPQDISSSMLRKYKCPCKSLAFLTIFFFF